MRLVFALPLIALFAFAGLGLVQLFDGRQPGFELEDRAAPTMAFDVLGEAEQLSFAELSNEAPILVNLWASWCAPCVVEHPLLMELAARHPGQIYGLAYEDTPENAARFLEARGNPFARLAMDPTGQGGLAFGLTGVPETFIIAPGGVITHHHRGVLSPGDVEELSERLSVSPAPTAAAASD
ncbi:MAG: redoxin family protein [Pseudomonadota bacterium]